MSTKVSEMSADERKALMDKLAEAIKKSGLEKDLDVTLSRETVCPLAAESVEDNFTIVVKKDLPPDAETKAKVEAFKKEADEITNGIEGASVAVNCIIGQGCQYDTIKDIVPIAGGDPVDLVHKEGEVWLVDFWATWCPPCQAPMQHNQDMLQKRAADWGDKVKIIGLSIDQSLETLQKHVETKGWTSPIHYWRAKSNASEVYQVRGVPHVMLIDTKGKIVFKGHPASRPDLEADFDTLLKGEEINVEGGEAKKEGAEGETASAEDTKDSAKCLAFIDKFKNEIAPGFQKNETMKQAAKAMPRAFCVMVYEEKLNVQTGKSSIDWKNYRVLVGSQANIDQCKAQIKEALDQDKQEFEIVEREHAI